MRLDKQILKFYNDLSLHNSDLPNNVKVMNPYEKPPAAVAKVIREFYHKFYGDRHERGLILGINPGRFGAGLTGIPFTDSYRLKGHCGIDFPEDTRETSSLFIYDVVSKYGGAAGFYKDWFIGAVSPLGFIHKNEKGNWVNYNYYDHPELEMAVRPFILNSLQRQKEICGNPETAVVLGTGKNFKYLKKINARLKLFKEIVPLEHPRYIMQYKLKQKEEFIEKFLRTLKGVKAYS